MLSKYTSIFTILCAFFLGLCFDVNLAHAKAINPAKSEIFYCASDFCKYAKGGVKFTQNFIWKLNWKGATFTGDCGGCSGTNDVKHWKLQHTAIFNDRTDEKIYGFSSNIWRNNCALSTRYWYVRPNKKRPADASAHFWWVFEKENGQTFTEYLRLDF